MAPGADATTLPLLLDAALAAALGLIIGLEREHSEAARAPSGGSAHETLLGVRTLALLALFGWAAAAAAGAHPWLPAVALLVGGALVVVAARSPHAAGHGLTTEVAALITLVLGMLVHQARGLAVALALLTALLLIAKPWFRLLVPRLRRVDFTATLQLLILLAIVLPQLSTRPLDPWEAVTPRRLGIFVALIAGIGYVGYVLNRLLGGERSARLVGLVGGLVSSTAVTAALAQQARLTPALVRPGQHGVLLANTVMLLRVLVVSALISPQVARVLSPPLLGMAVCMLAPVLWAWHRARGTPPAQPGVAAVALENPFSLVPALKWGVLLAVVLLASAAARATFGTSGLLVTAALSGLADVDAITLASARLTLGGALAPATAALAITVAVVSNTVVKSVLAWVSGGAGFGRHVAATSGTAVTVGLAVATVLHLVG